MRFIDRVLTKFNKNRVTIRKKCPHWCFFSVLWKNWQFVSKTGHIEWYVFVFDEIHSIQIKAYDVYWVVIVYCIDLIILSYSNGYNYCVHIMLMSHYYANYLLLLMKNIPVLSFIFIKTNCSWWTFRAIKNYIFFMMKNNKKNILLPGHWKSTIRNMFLYIVKIYFEMTPSYNDARISFMTNIINMRSFTQRERVVLQCGMEKKCICT